MAEYKLIYFNFRARAEIVRWIFKQGDIPFTDERINREDWPEKKNTIPGGKLPVLIVKEYTLPQSLAIARFAAKKAKLVPENDLEAAFIDALADTIYEIMTEFYKIRMSEKTEEEKKKAQKEEFLPKFVLPVMEKLEKRLTGREWYVSDNLTWGDLALGVFFSDLKLFDLDNLAKYPALKAHYEKVTSLPRIKEWLETRPKTEA